METVSQVFNGLIHLTLSLCIQGADRYILFCGPMFVAAFVLSQSNFPVKQPWCEP